MLTFLKKNSEFGHLILRVGLGSTSFFLRGITQMSGGAERYEELGGAMANIGITFTPLLWGFMAAFTECIGGLLLMLGLFVRPACIFLVFVMSMASIQGLVNNGTLMMARAHPLELGIAYLALRFLGVGKYSLDRKYGLG